MDIHPKQPDKHSNPYLSPKQQDLLLAALNSQAGGSSSLYNQATTSVDKKPKMTSDEAKALFMSPQDAELDSFDVDFTPDLDYLDGDTSYDFDNADLGGEMIGALPGSGSDENGEHNEKRKAQDDQEEGDSKRRETQDGEKIAKKPGRKPLTSEPTTKRKAQNRAAQRAFRERKEKHLKDLETKVAELEKASEADKHENGLLKAQVDRLQVELREYRKRMSLNSSGINRSPPVNAYGGQQRSNSNPLNSTNFQFDFPKFGGLPGSQIFGNQSFTSSNQSLSQRNSMTPSTTANSPPVSSRHGSQSQSRSGREDSIGRSLSPTSQTTSPSQMANVMPSFTTYSTNNNMHGFASTLPQMGGAGDPFGDLFSPSILKSAGMNNYFNSSESSEANQNGASNLGDGGNNGSGFSRVFQFNRDSSVSDTTSPGASSSSQWNLNGAANSSCGTSPEPSHDSPANKDVYNNKISPHASFADNTQITNTNNFTSPINLVESLNASNDFSIPSVGDFDPVLFGDYRDSNDAIVGNGDFTGGFFDEALNSTTFDYGSPSNLFGILQSPQQTSKSLNVNKTSVQAPKSSKNLMAEMDKVRDGGDDDYGLPNTKPKVESNGKMISCNNIWNQLQSNPDFQDGKFDLDSLCSELRMKARCSESGVMVDQAHVNAALKKLGKKDESGKVQDPPPLMFEQESWDKVLQKLGNSRQV